MKKLMCVLLAAMFVLAACTTDGNVSNVSDVSQEESLVPGVSYTLTKESIEKMYSDRDSVVNGEAVKTGKRVNHAEGKKYTVSSGDERFPNEKSALTDGIYKDTHYKFVKTGWVAVTGESAYVQVDLGTVVKGISDFEASSCMNTEYGADICEAVFVYISNDGESWKNVGIYQSSGLEADKARHSLSISLRGTVDARYVKFVFEGIKDEVLLLDEIGVFSYQEDNSTVQSGINKYYGAAEIPVITEEKYLEGDLTRKNLLLGLPTVTYEALTDTAADIAVTNYNTVPSKGLLTDGKYAKSANMSDGAWFRNTHGTGRIAVFDLGGIAAVDEVKVGFLASHGPGIYLPETMAVSVSLDGEEWHTVFETRKTSEATNSRVSYEGKFDKAYKARYVQISFSISTHVYLDEIEVFGNCDGKNAADPSETLIKNPAVSIGYGTPDQYDGMHDVVLSYLCPNEVRVTKDQYLAYVAYLEKGEIKDTYFDGFMYLPYVKYLYSGGQKKELTKDEWEAWNNWQFVADYNFDALDAAVDQTKEALGLDADYSVGTYLSLFYPVYGATNFGELNGKQMDFNKIEDRKAVLKWFVDIQLEAFKAKGYDSVRLSGFYWFVEEMSGSDPHVQELCNYICDYIRSLGYQTTWIPYFNASGNTSWKQFGFDTACLQPNYAFNEEIPLERIYDAANLAKLYGMSIEIEIESTSDVKWVNRYRDYLYAGADIGFMTESVHMYYLAGMPGAIYNAYVSANPDINCIYRETYLFIKGKLGAPDQAPEADDVTCKAGESVTGTLTLPEGSVSCEGVRLFIGAEHGTVSVNADGTFVYTPFEGFEGEDSFEVVADFGRAGVSLPGKITVTVTK